MLEKFKKRLFRFMEKDDVDIEKLKEMAMNGAMIIDVRSPQEYDEGHIEGSILITSNLENYWGFKNSMIK